MIEKLKAKQEKLNKTDEQFAKLLNISRPYWTMIKNGKRKNLGIKVIQGIKNCKELHDLNPYVDLYLIEGNHDNK